MKQLLALLLFLPSLCLAQLPDYVPTEELYGWYNLDGDAQDASGNGHHGQPQLIQPCSGVTNTSGGVEFTQQNSLIEWASDDWLSLEPQEAMTISIWFKSDFSQSPSHLFGKRSGCSGGNSINYQLAWQNDGFSQLLLMGMSLTLCDGFSAGFDVGPEWTHVVTTYDDGWGEMWVNGEIFMACSSLLGATNSSPFLLGGSGTCTGFYGCMDQLGIWNRALTAVEISEIYSSSSPISGCTDSLACNFQPSADMDDGSCVSCEVLASACGEGTTWDSSIGKCVVANPTDVDLDLCTGVNDVLAILVQFGQCYESDETTDTTWTCGDPLTYWDYDYSTVLIGDQCWFAENLRASSFSDGTTIPEEPDPGNWLALTTDARCHYDNVNSNAESFGTLYNWYAVTSAAGLCPNDWHVPGDSEWMVLEQVLGIPENQLGNVGWRGEAELAGIQLRASTSDLPGWNGSNEIGFSALPGGWRTETGQFLNLDQGGYWWTSSNIESSRPCRGVLEGFSGIDRYLAHPAFGFSVRCVKD